MAEKRDITVDVTIRSDTKGADKAAASLGDVDKAAGKAAKGMKGMEVDSKSLEKQITTSKETIKGLEAELTKVGNNPGLRKSLNVERSWLTELEKVSKSLVPDKMPAPKLDFGAAASGLMPALIGVAVLAAPALGAIVGGAVVGAVGAGGILGGVAAAAGDERVQAAWHDLTSGLTAESFGRQEFIQPTIKAIGILKSGIDSLNIEDTIAKGADAVPHLAKGLINFAQGVMPGVDAAMSHADEIAGIFEDGLGDVGNAVGDLIQDFADSEGSMDGLRLTFSATGDVIRATGEMVSDLGDAFHWLSTWTPAVGDAMADIVFWLPPLSHYMQENADKLREVGGETQTTTGYLHAFGDETIRAKLGLDPFAAAAVVAGEAVDDLSAAVDKAIQGQLSIDQATLAWEQSLDDLAASVKENGRSLDVTTDKGRANERAILDGVKAAQDQRQANINSGMSAADAALKYDEQIKKLDALASKLGISKKALDAITGNYNINITTTQRTNIIETHSEDYRMYGGARAAGGPVLAGVPYTINERGYETVTFPAGGEVHPANLSPMTADSGGGSGVQELRVTYVPTGNRLIDAIMEMLRIEVKGMGGPLKAFS